LIIIIYLSDACPSGISFFIFIDLIFLVLKNLHNSYL